MGHASCDRVASCAETVGGGRAWARGCVMGQIDCLVAKPERVVVTHDYSAPKSEVRGRAEGGCDPCGREGAV